MTKFRFASTIMVASLIFTALTFLVLPASVQGSPTALTPDQLRLVAEKEQAREAAGLSDPGDIAADAKPDPKVRSYSKTLQTTKAELLERWKEGWEANEDYLSQLEQNAPRSAQQKREDLLETREEIEALPAGPVTLEIPSVETGEHSISYSREAGNSTLSNPTDPVNLIFWNVGSAWNVNYDLQNWTDEEWEGTCGATLYVGIWDSVHHSGMDVIKEHDYQLTPVSDTNACTLPGAARNHLRLWSSVVPDSHGEYGEWSVGQAHHDDWGHDCPDDWEDAERRVVDSFLDNSGNYLWFVGSVWDVWMDNAGQYQCAWNNGYGRYIELSS